MAMSAPRRIIRVLLAEDNADHAFLAKHELSKAEGVETDLVIVSDGQEALDYLRDKGTQGQPAAPDIVVLDLSMPRKGGFDVLREVRADPDLQGLPVVILTSSTRLEDIEASYKMGANAFVAKSQQGMKTLVEFWTRAAELPPH